MGKRNKSLIESSLESERIHKYCVSSPNKGLYTGEWLEAHYGTDVRRLPGDHDPAERETGLIYRLKERDCEITTSEGALMKKLERAGIMPHVVNVFKEDGAEHRVYWAPRRIVKIMVRPSSNRG